uniref:R-spondin 4 n=1 Tax=Neogobius melanostomus TaxID=47308 RepID=A0A8C6UMQ2_9GOBI
KSSKEQGKVMFGCLECSRDNGCVRCPERLFLFLQRDGMSHHGTCLLTCPPGHYEQKGKDMNRCMSTCSILLRDFCTKCKAGFQLYKGKCLSRCPQGTFPHHTDCLGECIASLLGFIRLFPLKNRTKLLVASIRTLASQQEGSQLNQISGSYHCLLAPTGEWSEWGVCQRDGATCGYRWGKQTRTRGTSDNQTTTYCPLQAEMQRCRMKKRCTPPKKGTSLMFLLHTVKAARQKRLETPDLEHVVPKLWGRLPLHHLGNPTVC